MCVRYLNCYRLNVPPPFSIEWWIKKKLLVPTY
nr:MAG TPA: hypothetical protein [Bacteriophage sp.]